MRMDGYRGMAWLAPALCAMGCGDGDVSLPPVDLAPPGGDYSVGVDFTTPLDLAPLIDLAPARDLAPTCSDGVKNGGESDIDCGGGCPHCASGRRCAVALD